MIELEKADIFEILTRLLNTFEKAISGKADRCTGIKTFRDALSLKLWSLK